ncbi:MAG: cation transporter [Phycisphaeraceae bacterium]|nr:MAG: cation transporter [Phycisphaeraceae bacterium]
MSSTGYATANHSTFTLTIDGMTCGHCVQAVTKALVGVQGVGVRLVVVGSAEITAPDGLTVARAVAVLDEAGYSARVSETRESASRAGCCG